ncbi:MAG: glycosyltransferase family 4 protein [Blastocatellia bacterium]|nr:glycosyltransferase family 4 protein [Blastocatellia bacterium]
MKILQISSAQEFGGAERHVVDLSIELASRGHEIHLAVRPFSPLPSQVKDFGINCHTLALRGAIDLISAYKLANLIQKLKIDVVHTHYARDYPLTAIAVHLSQKLGVKPKFFLTRHHYLPVKANWAYSHLLSNVDTVIAVSTSVRDTWAKFFNLKFYTSNNSYPKLAVIPNWINREKFIISDTQEESRQKLGISSNLPVVGIVNQLTQAKGQHLLLEAVTKLKAPCFVVFAGNEHNKEKPYTKYLEDLAKKFNLTEQVKFLGHVKDLASLYNALDIVVIPSENEAFSIVCLESMICHRPVIVANVGGLAELVKDSKTGLVFPVGSSDLLAEKLNLLINDKNLAKTLAQNAYSFVEEKFLMKKVISQIEQLYLNK